MVAVARIPALSAPGARLLCLGAHADDLEIGAGATISRLVAEHPGLAVSWLVLTGDGMRAEEAHASAGDLLARARDGAPGPGDEVDVAGLPDGRLPANWDAAKDRVEAWKDRAPTLVLAPWVEDRHQDHRVVAELAWQTFRDQVIWSYEIPKYDGDLGRPNLHVGLDDEQAAAKLAHLARHFPSQHDRQWYDEELFRAHLRLRGVECNRRWAEAFHARLAW